MSDHPGFEFWKLSDPHPFPVGNIDLSWGDETSANASAEFTLPQTQPEKKTVAERSIGITDSAQLWFALECTTDAQGKVNCEAVLRGRHVHWFPDHGECAPGPVQEIRLSAADLKGGGRKEVLGAHGPHCDLFDATWWQKANGGIGCELSVWHFQYTVQGFLDMRARAQREAEHYPKFDWPHPDYHLPDPSPTPPPKPDPGPNPN
jgi:hypothetical protein